MKYLIYGAGGIGGCLAAFLAQGGKDVSLIARGAHLEAIQKNGLVLETGHGTFAVPVRACEQEQVTDRPDVIFGGRLGEYKYYDMDKVIEVALDVAAKELK